MKKTIKLFSNINKSMACILLMTIITPSALSQSFASYVDEIKKEAINQGIRPSVLNQAFANVTAPSSKVSSLDSSQPEHRITYNSYLKSRADSYRIYLGKKEFKKNYPLLNNIQNTSGVNACIVTSIWGLESSYGRFKGSFPVIQSLTTLSYQGRRTEFFREQLLYALHMLNDNAVSLEDFKGEWAGASGHSQFIPSSWYQYAVDYNNDGKKDIWHNIPDALASIANYLKQNGWQENQPTLATVFIPYSIPENLMSLKVEKSVSQWEKLGVKLPYGSKIPNNMTASIIKPDGGPDLMVFNNFKVLMSWNYSSYYAGTVTYMADQICKNNKGYTPMARSAEDINKGLTYNRN